MILYHLRNYNLYVNTKRKHSILTIISHCAISVEHDLRQMRSKAVITVWRSLYFRDQRHQMIFTLVFYKCRVIKVCMCVCVYVLNRQVLVLCTVQTDLCELAICDLRSSQLANNYYLLELLRAYLISHIWTVL